MKEMRVLIACEFSGVVREAFKSKGHYAVSCDLLDTEIPGEHYKGKIETMLKDGCHWDLLIAHPPCTYLCNSGVRWLYNSDGSKNEERWEKMREGAEFFKMLLDAPIKKKVIENPIPHKHALKIIGRKYDQIIQPWQYGHGETKATCLWIENVPKLKSTKIVSGREGRIHKMPPSEERSKLRSITFSGIAEAMSKQY